MEKGGKYFTKGGNYIASLCEILTSLSISDLRKEIQ